ncbi:unnamed protein product [Ascophyllum nodosum]
MGGKDSGAGEMDAIAIFDQVMSTAIPCSTAWDEVGLSALRPSLDQQALAIAENQESSLETRKELAAQAKAFRQSVEADLGATSDIRTASGVLVRAFKAEIDSLTTRSRFAENSFLTLYKLLREAPDPAITVTALANAARAAFKALEGRSRSLDERGRETFRQLEALRASTAARGGGSLTPEELQEERRVLREEIAAEQKEAEQARLQALQDAVQEELLMAQRQAEQERAAGQAQLQVLQQEVERLEARAVLVEEEAARAAALEEGAGAREALLKTLQEKASPRQLYRASTTARALAAVRAKDEAVAGWAEARARTEATERSAKGWVRELEEEATRLRRELGTRADAAQASRSFLERKQIRILEGIWGDEPVPASTTSHGDETPEKNGPRPRRNEARSEGHRRLADIVDRVGEREPRTENAARSSEADGGDGPGGAETDEGKGKKICDGEGGDDPEAGDRGLREGGQEGEGGVDAWLISYNRRLKSELERLRGRARQAEERLREVEAKRTAEAAELVERRQEVKRLEQDLVDAHQVVEAGKTMLRAFQSGAVAKQFGKLIGRGEGEAGGGGEIDGEACRGPDDDLMEGVEEGDAVPGVPGSEGFSAADRLLGAVKRQRERFRKEAVRREREASIAKSNAEHLARDNQELRRENMQLYKKIRYVMSYGSKGCDDPTFSGGEGADGATERKYKRLYEDGLDPFREFDSQEKAARRGQMGAVERWLLWSSGAVLKNRLRRHLLVVYLMILHGVLLLMPRYRAGSGVPAV